MSIKSITNSLSNITTSNIKNNLFNNTRNKNNIPLIVPSQEKKETENKDEKENKPKLKFNTNITFPINPNPDANNTPTVSTPQFPLPPITILPPNITIKPCINMVLPKRLGDKTIELRRKHILTKFEYVYSLVDLYFSYKLDLNDLFEVVKVVDSKSSFTRSVIINKNKGSVENRKEEQLLLLDEKERLTKFGKFEPDFYCKIEKDIRNRNNKDYEFVLWLGNNDLYIPSSKERKVLNSDSQKNKRIQYLKRLIIANLKKYDIIPLDERENSVYPSIVFTGSSEKILKMEKELRNKIGLLKEHDGSMIEDLSTGMSVSNADDVVTAGGTGKDVNVAVWENGPTQRALYLTLEDTYNASFTSDHARIVSGIIKNNGVGRDPKGFAPECKLYSANSGNIAALRWAVNDKKCTVINQSFHRLDEARNGNLSSDDIEKDYMAYHYPYPFIVQAAGNFWYQTVVGARLNDSIDGTIAGQIGPAPPSGEPGSNEYVNHKGFNSICAANHNDTASALSTGSVFRNPLSLHNDRELPEISANGTGVTAVGIGPWDGTSFSSPATAGIGAQLQGINNAIKTWPEACRAIILAGARDNITNGEWFPDVKANIDARDGSGIIDALRSAEVAPVRRTKNSPATYLGWDGSYLPVSSFNSKDRLSNFYYEIQVPSYDHQKNPIKYSIVKVALCWAATVTTQTSQGQTTYLSSRLPMDLDLHIYDKNNRLVAISNTWDNSYEIARFCGIAGEKYKIRIKRWSGSSYTWYGIAWRSY